LKSDDIFKQLKLNDEHIALISGAIEQLITQLTNKVVDYIVEELEKIGITEKEARRICNKARMRMVRELMEQFMSYVK
jgi:phosphoserine phosphatase